MTSTVRADCPVAPRRSRPLPSGQIVRAASHREGETDAYCDQRLRPHRVVRLSRRWGERHPDLDIVAINDLFDSDTNAHLLKYDSNYGTFDGTIEATDAGLVVNGHEIKGCSEREWTDLPWGELGY